MSVREMFWAWDSGCRSKVRYSKARHATQRILQISQLSSRQGMDLLRTYHCRFCGGWHLGHLRSEAQGKGE